MTTPIRPGFPQTLPTPQRSSAASDAQRAFFQAAMQGSAPAAAPRATVPATIAPPVRMATPVQETPVAQDPQAVRPGRYLNIVV